LKIRTVLYPDLSARSKRSDAYNVTGTARYIQVCANEFVDIVRNVILDKL